MPRPDELPPDRLTWVNRCCPAECVEEKEKLRARVKELERQIEDYKNRNDYLLSRILALFEAYYGTQ